MQVIIAFGLQVGTRSVKWRKRVLKAFLVLLAMWTRILWEPLRETTTILPKMISQKVQISRRHICTKDSNRWTTSLPMTTTGAISIHRFWVLSKCKKIKTRWTILRNIRTKIPCPLRTILKVKSIDMLASSKPQIRSLIVHRVRRRPMLDRVDNRQKSIYWETTSIHRVSRCLPKTFRVWK